ncbi:hypothetical protein CCAL9344_04120 [Campylobacter sp. RM9344]|uniref:Protein hydE n=1 Tax=Campylobacter californiensis TaxID=1032243 RepID=A0AAW3ZWA0_9BACT|nr:MULTISPECIES: hypothetical protein [unclassified Campylobacter]MBE2984285.1 hypothetical protein [Campylobacter sp. RM6883]MBE2994848.1 hypothetical protein [Campylobacter sp. RM6913]MBE3029376.1 hypothetical protein [Campylobacter sp. RM9344]MBE3607979.1 hypothetical protein [Campylobacter sp. RM9337]
MSIRRKVFMVLAFEFLWIKELVWLEIILRQTAKNLPHKVVKDSEGLTLFISANESELSKFSDKLCINLPSSLFIKGFRVYEASMPNDKSDKDVHLECDLPALTPLQELNFKQNGQICKNEFGVLSKISVLDQKICEENFNLLLGQCAKKIKDGEVVKFKSSSSEFEVEILHSFDKFDFIMPTNSKALLNIFTFNEREITALASFEKPMLRLKTNALFKQKHPQIQTTANVKLSQDFFIFALCDKLYNDKINFIGVRNLGKNSIFKFCLFDKESLVYDSSSKEELESDYFELNLNKDSADGIFLVRKNDKIPLLFIPNFISFDEIFKEIKGLDGGERLLENFAKTYVLPSENLNLNANFYSLFCMSAKVLNFSPNLKQAGERLLLNAFNFGANRGVLIDCKVKDGVFDVAKFIRSTMSFMLAGAQEGNISYGVVSSLAGFLANFILEKADEFDIKTVKFSGDLFKEEAVLKTFKREFEPNFKLDFSSLGIKISL